MSEQSRQKGTFQLRLPLIWPLHGRCGEGLAFPDAFFRSRLPENEVTGK